MPMPPNFRGMPPQAMGRGPAAPMPQRAPMPAAPAQAGAGRPPMPAMPSAPAGGIAGLQRQPQMPVGAAGGRPFKKGGPVSRPKKFEDGGYVNRDTAPSEAGRTERNFKKLTKSGIDLDIDGRFNPDRTPEQKAALKRAGKKLRDEAWDEAESYSGNTFEKGRKFSKEQFYKKGGPVKAKAANKYAKGGLVKKGGNSRRARKGMCD